MNYCRVLKSALVSVLIVFCVSCSARKATPKVEETVSTPEASQQDVEVSEELLELPSGGNDLALMILVDKSKNMAGEDRFSSVVEAVRGLIDMLRDDDYLGVLGFDYVPYVIARLEKVERIREQASRRLGYIRPSGEAGLFSSLIAARVEFEKVRIDAKHILIVTGGDLEALEVCLQYVSEMKADDVTTSVVIIGSGEFKAMRALSRLGGGRFYVTSHSELLKNMMVDDIVHVIED